MPAYVISHQRVPDPDADELARYREASGPIVTRYGGRFIARGGPIDVLTGGRAYDPTLGSGIRLIGLMSPVHHIQNTLGLPVDKCIQLGIEAVNALQMNARHLHRRNALCPDLSSNKAG